MNHWPRRWIGLACLSLVLLLSACGGSDEDKTERGPSLASDSDVTVASHQAGSTPFVQFVQLSGNSLGLVATLSYSIEPKAGAASKPVSVSYSARALGKRGYAAPRIATATVPVFGLYAGHANHVSMTVWFVDGSSQVIPVDLQTAAYVDPNGIYDRPTVLTKRVAGDALGFDYFAMKSGLGSPIVLDTDGEIRWVGSLAVNSISTIFHDNGFYVGEQGAKTFHRMELDGAITDTSLISQTITNFHHHIDPGKVGLLANVNTFANGMAQIESTLAEFSPSGVVLNEWDLAAIISNYMRGQGDDPTGFVRPGVDWFHMNAATYDRRDDSVIVSSRENFLIKINYATGNIVWILGDPSKYWFTFASLRAKALTLEAGGLVPIGQHSTSITSDGYLMVFNDGFPSANMPAGAAAGDTRHFSAVSAYDIDVDTMTAREVWRFDHGQDILSIVCSSVYESGEKSLLVNYSVADNFAHARVVGLNAARSVVFDFQYENKSSCTTGWNAIPVPFNDLKFD